MDKLTPQRRSETCVRSGERIQRRSWRYVSFAGSLALPAIAFTAKTYLESPDLAWIGRKLAVFVHGCFWHSHNCVEGVRKPKSNRNYWIPKIERNRQRDSENITALKAVGWKVLVVWECEITEKDFFISKLNKFLSTGE